MCAREPEVQEGKGRRRRPRRDLLGGRCRWQECNECLNGEGRVVGAKAQPGSMGLGAWEQRP
jgi:hypothetical protein